MRLAQTDIDDLVAVWHEYCDSIGDWQALVRGAALKQTGNGAVYELPTPLKDRHRESFAICDMRGIKVSEPHYHPADNWEFYFILSGTARLFVGEQERAVTKGDVVVIPPDIAHFTLPGADFVLAVVSSPPFTPENYITLGASDESRLEVEFDLDKFKRLTNKL